MLKDSFSFCFHVCFFSACCLLGTAFAAPNNPQIRICQSLHGEFLAAQNNEDQVGLCRFDSAYVGTIDLLQFKDAGTNVESIQAYRDHAKSCEPYGQLKSVKVLNQNELLEICAFQDGSLMLNKTLEAGIRAAVNQRLNQALGL